MNRQKQARGRGGWGGVQELEKWRKYRSEDLDDGPAYEMIHGEEDIKDQHDKSSGGKRASVHDVTPKGLQSGGSITKPSYRKEDDRRWRGDDAKGERRDGDKNSSRAVRRYGERSRSPKRDELRDYRRYRDGSRQDAKHRDRHRSS
ncbi:peptidyl-prolyl cis-trans isomerase-like protein [Grosmannia clavigera kw1407]|uniref:Peptidyl-prolyl cis-trans isomerase-like protein n=1 Tax=Grosmannia clavigera (strain kw1407 / UAMH 11150) TaxID=655863 RepID=F0XRM0_GROCL|nr:peptidyl-prolyl cis-trans isomerase-like protein [Grosmannia clavigera kw1407]EFW99670.1 peptidyl-prolyl cis-trans isomerase-like protein [Grosmannia clavigera kw1407]